jgi:hypothetical protein
MAVGGYGRSMRVDRPDAAASGSASELEARVDVLQDRVRERLAELRALGPSRPGQASQAGRPSQAGPADPAGQAIPANQPAHPGFPGPDDDVRDPATDAVIEAATALIEYEEQLPVLLDRAPQRLSLQIVRWSGVLTAAVGASLAVAAVAGWVARGWVLAALLPCVAAVVLLSLPVPRPRGPHRAARPGSVVAAAGGCLITLVAVARLPLWPAGVGALVLLGGLWHAARAREVPVRGLRPEDVRIRDALRRGSR